MTPRRFRLNADDLTCITAFMLLECEDGNEVVVADIVRLAIDSYLDKAEQGTVLLRQLSGEDEVVGDYTTVSFDLDDERVARCAAIATKYNCNQAQVFRNAVRDHVIEHMAHYAEKIPAYKAARSGSG